MAASQCLYKCRGLFLPAHEPVHRSLQMHNVGTMQLWVTLVPSGFLHMVESEADSTIEGALEAQANPRLPRFLRREQPLVFDLSPILRDKGSVQLRVVIDNYASVLAQLKAV